MTGKLILTTVGTSCFEGDKLKRVGLTSSYGKLKHYFRHFDDDRLPKWIEDKATFKQADTFIDAYVQRLLQYDIASEVKKPSEDGVNVFSAEMTSLYLMYQDAKLELDPEQDRIILLLSESVEGVLSGLINERLLTEGKYLQGQTVAPELSLVPGLQIKNFNRFFSEGLQAFLDQICDAAKASPTKEPILNITGGYKALVAYAAYFAYVEKFSLVSVFEELTDVVKIQFSSQPDQGEQVYNDLGLGRDRTDPNG